MSTELQALHEENERLRKENQKLVGRLDEWLVFEERSGWTLKEFCETRGCPIRHISVLTDELKKYTSEIPK